MRLAYTLIKRQRWGFFRYKKAPLRAGPIYYLNDELKRYPDVKKDQEYATGKVVRKFLSGQMKVDKDTLDAIKKPVDNVTKVNIIESSELLLSDRYSSYMDAVIDLSDDNELSKAVKGVHGSKRYKVIAEYIRKALGKEITLSDGRTAIVDNSDASHIASGAGDNKTREIAKIKDLVSQATLHAYDDTVEHNKFDHFLYYKAVVRYDNEKFPLYLNVGRGINDKKYHLYDITKKIKDTANRINGFERPKPNEGYALQNGISDNSISQTDDFVNTQSENILLSDRESYAPIFSTVTW